jgi:hypothetical protein
MKTINTLSFSVMNLDDLLEGLLFAAATFVVLVGALAACMAPAVV